VHKNGSVRHLHQAISYLFNTDGVLPALEIVVRRIPS